MWFTRPHVSYVAKRLAAYQSFFAFKVHFSKHAKEEEIWFFELPRHLV